jgi:hypothetical protein
MEIPRTSPMWSWPSPTLRSCRQAAAKMQIDRTAGQKHRLAVICEAAGMAPQLARVAQEFGVTVNLTLVVYRQRRRLPR